MIEPKKPQGDDAEARWCQWAHDQIKRLRPISVAGVKMGRTRRGDYAIEIPQKESKKIGGWGLAFWCKIKTRRAFTPFLQFFFPTVDNGVITPVPSIPADSPDVYFSFIPSDFTGQVAAIAKDPFRAVSNTVADTGTATSGTATTLTNSIRAWTINAFAGWHVKITGGTGAGQVRLIDSNTMTVLTSLEPWTTIPDSTSAYVIYFNFFIPPPAEGDWHFYYFGFSADRNLTMRYSVDGAPRATLFESVYMSGFPATAGTPTGGLRIQTGVAGIDTGADPFMSEVVYDEIAIRTTGEFTDNEIAYFYNGAAGRTFPVDPPIAAYWDLESAPATCADSVNGVELVPYTVAPPPGIAAQAKLSGDSGIIGSGLGIGYGSPEAACSWYAGLKTDVVPELGIHGTLGP